jgi:hypothetical protein
MRRLPLEETLPILLFFPERTATTTVNEPED